MAGFVAGPIVIVDWRSDARPREPNKRRPAVVIEDDGLFGPSYPNVLVVPLTEALDWMIEDLSVVIDPTPENGCTKRCAALAHAVAIVSAERVRGTESRVTTGQLAAMRKMIAVAIGLG